MKDLKLTPTESETYGSVHVKGEEAAAGKLVSVSDANKPELIFNTFRPC